MGGLAVFRSQWRRSAALAVVLAAILWLISVPLGSFPLRAITFVALAVALTIVAFGYREATGKLIRGQVGLILFAAGFAILALSFLLSPLLGSSWTPVIVFGLTLYAVFGLAVVILLADAVISIVAMRRADSAAGSSRAVSFVPTILGVTAFVSLLSTYLPYPEWLTFLLPVVCIAAAAYLLFVRRAAESNF